MAANLSENAIFVGYLTCQPERRFFWLISSCLSNFPPYNAPPLSEKTSVFSDKQGSHFQYFNLNKIELKNS